MRYPLLCAILLAAFSQSLALPAAAHQINLLTTRLALSHDRTVNVEMGLKGSDVDRLIGTRLYDAKEDAVDPAAVAAATPAILTYLNANLGISNNSGVACAASQGRIFADGDGVIFRNTYSCATVPGDILYRSMVLTENDPTARQVVLIVQGGQEAQALLDADKTTVTLSAPPPSLASTMDSYLIAGIEHIFLGYDHIAFLVAVVLWATRIMPVIKIVTAFTIAHSITLSLAALGIVVIPSRIVEPAIAASIVFVAIENFFSRDLDRRWRVTFMFGLIHGFGFASVLKEIGVPPHAIVPALAAFNIGVEIGQVAIVAIVIPALIALEQLAAIDRAKPARRAALVYALSAVITVLGSYWFFTRVLDA